MSTPDDDVEISFAEVAAESPAESLSHEHDAVGAATDGDTAEPPAEPPAAPEGDDEPTLGSMLGGGPVS